MASNFRTETNKQREYLRIMLTEGVHSDVAIIPGAGDPEEIKCHKFILTDRSDVFKAMFQDTSKSKESITGIIKMDDMCSNSVKAFLTFLYLDDLQTAEEDSAISLDLFRASHKYNVPTLQKRMKKILLEKPDNWFTVEEAMELYFLVRNLEDGEALKMKALEIMKANHLKLNEAPDYIQLFEKTPKAARELCADIISLQPKIKITTPTVYRARVKWNEC